MRVLEFVCACVRPLSTEGERDEGTCNAFIFGRRAIEANGGECYCRTCLVFPF